MSFSPLVTVNIFPKNVEKVKVFLTTLIDGCLKITSENYNVQSLK